MDRRRRRRYGESRRPNSVRSMVVAGVSAVSILIYIVFLLISVGSKGDTPNVLGGLAMLDMLIAFVCLFLGIKDFRDDSYNTTTRMIGLVLSILATLAWLVLYVAGMLMA